MKIQIDNEKQVAHLLKLKMKKDFVVRFSCTFTETENCSSIDAAKHLQVLSSQMSKFNCPGETLSIRLFNPTRMAHSAFRHFHADGISSFVFEDDIDNKLQEALDFIVRPDVIRINILVMKVSKEQVTESFFFGSCKIKSIAHSALDYNDSTSVEKTMVFDALYTQRALFKDQITFEELYTLILGT